MNVSVEVQKVMEVNNRISFLISMQNSILVAVLIHRGWVDTHPLEFQPF